MSKKSDEIMEYLHSNVFDPILSSPIASKELKAGVNLTIVRMNQRDEIGMIQYYWSAVIGTERSTKFARLMKKEGFTRFEEIIEDFRDRFNDKWIRTK
jgi:hypothetical protein